VRRGAITVVAVVAVVACAAAAWLGRENRRLGRELAAARAAVDGAGRAAGRDAGGGLAAAGPGRAIGRGLRAGDPAGLLGAVGRAMVARPAADAPDAGPGDADWEARRDRRQQRLRELLGRRPGESAEDYRARVAPMVTAALAIPRERAEEKRREFEEAAGVTAEQREKMDAALHQSTDELVGLANGAIASGALTPYRRNTRGVLDFVAQAAGPADALDQRLRGIFTPEQLATMEEAGFDPLEYLGVNAPWETLDPPPEPPRP
jgi:hypothetical protein